MVREEVSLTRSAGSSQLEWMESIVAVVSSTSDVGDSTLFLRSPASATRGGVLEDPNQ